MGVLVILYMVNLIGTGSRVGWVALGCALIVFFIFMQHRYKYALGALIVLSVIIVFLASSLISHLPTTERLTLKNSISLSWRIDCYKEGLAMVRDNPVFGLGTGNYMIEYYNYLEHVPRLSRIMVGWLHNSYLLIWIENGTIGFLVFLAFMASVGLGLVWVYLEAADKEIKIIALGLLTAFVGFAVEFAGIPAIGQEMGWIILSLSVALIALNRKEKQVLSTNRLFVFCKTEGNLT
jgi:O-antigen ligase